MKLLHRSQKPGALWYGNMLGAWSTRYLPGGMKAVTQPSPFSGSTPNMPLLPKVPAVACAGAARPVNVSSAQVANTASVWRRCPVITSSL
jgi:hypothetical protein